MLHIKRLYTFILQTFLPVFCMTFLICLFIVLMQFIWRYIDEMVGKGLEISVLAELFFYAAMSMVPMALPLAVLLASLMAFGNLAERLELLAMKASGVSLLQIMRPVMIFIACLAMGAFFFQDQIMPRTQVKLYSLLYSMRHKSPELDIPEGIFYKEIDGYNIYVKHKNPETGMLYDVMIYDISGSFEDVSVTVADSGKLKMADDRRHLFLTLWSGESFQNLQQQKKKKANVPYQRETFSKKEIMIEFDTNFNRMDESVMSNQYIGKNMSQLSSSVDSLSLRKDSISQQYVKHLKESAYFKGNVGNVDSLSAVLPITDILKLDSIYRELPLRTQQTLANKAVIKANVIRQDYEFKASLQKDDNKIIRRHKIEIHRKFTLSFACIIFFFIGAPLGAIIGKGGLGMPVIVSIFLFIVYYVIDNTGYKMARDGQMAVAEGIWLSSAVLLPLGIFFTYKAVNDSVLFNADVIRNHFLNFFGIQKKRSFTRKEVIIETLDKEKFSQEIESFNIQCEDYLSNANDTRSINFINFYLKRFAPTGLAELVTRFNILMEEGSNAAEQPVLKKMAEYPVLFKMGFGAPFNKIYWQIPTLLFLPISIPYYLLALLKRKKRISSIKQVIRINKELVILLKN